MSLALSKYGQSSFSAMIGSVVCITLVAGAIGWVCSEAYLVSERYEQEELANLAIVLSNDLLLNPGYSEGIGWTAENVGHVGLARYNFGRKSVDEHVLDPGKVEELRKVLGSEPEKVQEMWNIESQFWIVVEDLDGKEILVEYMPKVNFTSKVSVSRLGLLGGRHAKVTLVLFE